MNRPIVAASSCGARLAAMLAALLLGLSALPCRVVADDAVDDRSIAASVNVPAQGLSCDEAAAQASVSFKALNIPFDVQRVSVFVDGNGLQESAVDQAWPTVVVRQGLHPGRNLVEFILYGPDNQSMDRKQTVLIGTPPTAGDVAPAQIACVGTVAADDEAVQPALATEETASDAPPAVDPDAAYYEGPVYTYYPAPVFFGPVIPVGYFSAPPVIYAPPPPLFFYNHYGPRYHGGYYGHSDHDHDHDHRGDHAHEHDGGGHGSPPGGPPSAGGFGRPHDNAPPVAPHGTFNTYSPPRYDGNAGRDASDRPTSSQFSHDGVMGRPGPQQIFHAPPVATPRASSTPPQQMNPPRQMPPPNRQMPLPTQRFSGPPPQAPHGGAPQQQRPR
ncbi:MAG: hypothetical protein JWR16_2445 [Nevskia sp.]|nr:hypothetical protein [Nevskia sp.]